jgi:hypothetical protein
MPEIVVFLGPSLPRDKAEQIIQADFRPPAKRGDLFKAAKDGADIICLIDGVFFQDCSVAHKEILYALEHGIRVIGASSMGALRASELDVFGMEGVGEIYQAYKRGRLVSDDEVALIFEPFTWEPRSEPLVNIRFNLDNAWQRGIIDTATRDRLFRCAESFYFPERTYERMMQAAEGRVAAEMLQRFREFINTERRDFKMEDAIKALQRVKAIANESIEV